MGGFGELFGGFDATFGGVVDLVGCLADGLPGVVRDLVGGREARILLDTNLTALRNVSVRRGRLGRARLVLELADARPAFDVLDPDAWASSIAEARREAPAFPPGTVPVVQTIEREVVKIRCRFCGQLGNEVNGRCPACGAPL